MDKKKFNGVLRKAWFFIWEDESIWSWLVNIVLAFVLIKFVVYPGLGFAFSTSHPIVAVVSGSMEHGLDSSNSICGKVVVDYSSSLDNWWFTCGSWYGSVNISKEDFVKFPFKNGFNTGDIMVLYGTKVKDLKVGEVIVYTTNRPDPIIHRVVKKSESGGIVYLQTKGDHNDMSYSFEQNIPESDYIGKAVLRIPLLGYIKIWFVKLVSLVTLMV